MSHSAATESATSALSQSNDNFTSGDVFRSLQLLKQIAADASLQGPYRITMLHAVEAFKSHHRISFHAPRRHPQGEMVVLKRCGCGFSPSIPVYTSKHVKNCANAQMYNLYPKYCVHCETWYDSNNN
jgi:hypothetical protein